MKADTIIDIVGWLGATAYLVPYLLLVNKKLSSTSFWYLFLNIVGGVFLIINTAYHGSIPSAVSNTVWAAVGIYGMLKGKRERKLALLAAQK